MRLVFEDVSRFDVIHFHCDYLQFPFLERYPCRSVTTIHGRLHTPDLRDLFDEYPDVPLVSISDLYTFRKETGSYLAFLGRISPDWTGPSKSRTRRAAT